MCEYKRRGYKLTRCSEAGVQIYFIINKQHARGGWVDLAIYFAVIGQPVKWV